MATKEKEQVDRIKTNVTAALAAIAEKGVTVPGDANSDDLEWLIGQLVKLPALASPGETDDLRSGKQLIDESGNIVTGTMPEQAAQTITPGTTNKTIEAGRYLSGTQTIKGDSNLVAANIVSGKTIFGVNGSYTGGANITSGTFTISAGVKTHTLTHGRGETPNFAMAILEAGYVVLYVYSFFMLNYNNTSWVLKTVFNSDYESYDVNMVKTTNANITGAQTIGFGNATDSTIKFTRDISSYSNTYWYMVGVI